MLEAFHCSDIFHNSFCLLNAKENIQTVKIWQLEIKSQNLNTFTILQSEYIGLDSLMRLCIHWDNRFSTNSIDRLISRPYLFLINMRHLDIIENITLLSLSIPFLLILLQNYALILSKIGSSLKFHVFSNNFVKTILLPKFGSGKDFLCSIIIKHKHYG